MYYNGKEVPEVVIKRLPRYYRYLTYCMQENASSISSKRLSEMMNLTASQIRQDFNHFGGFGQQGYGYNVEYLKNEIASILGLTEGYKAVILGAGHLGMALANHNSFEQRGFNICALFDIDKEKIGKTANDKPIYDIKDIENYISENDVKIAIITIPKDIVPDYVDKLVDAGIEGFWNFTSCEIKSNKPIAVENVHMSDSLMTLSYKIKQK